MNLEALTTGPEPGRLAELSSPALVRPVGRKGMQAANTASPGVSCARAGRSHHNRQNAADTRHPPRTYVDSRVRFRPLAFAAFLALSHLIITGPAAVQAGDRGAVGDLYACNTYFGNILQFDGMTGDFVCIFAETPPDFPGQKPQPFDLAWAPNGHLWVTFEGYFPYQPDGVVEFDGQSGAFIRYILPPAPNSPPGITLSFGGRNGNFYLPEAEGVLGNEVYEFDRVTCQNLGVVVSPSPPMIAPGCARFLSNGNYLLLGGSIMTPVPTVREYDPSTTPFTFVRDIVVEAATARGGAIETPDGRCYLLSTSDRNRVDKYDIGTGAFVGELIPRSPCLDTPSDPCYFDAMDGPGDLAYGPNGNLYVSAQWTAVPPEPPSPFCPAPFIAHLGAVHEFDPQTGVQIRVIGKQEVPCDCAVPCNTARFKQPGGIEFKPLPGDFGSSGAAFQGDWVVDENDLARFVAALVGSAPAWTTAANLLSFDQDRDNDVDCDDWPAFQAAFLASSGYSPELPLPEIPDFVAALLGEGDRPCLADRNGDGAVDGLDVAPFVQALLSP